MTSFTPHLSASKVWTVLLSTTLVLFLFSHTLQAQVSRGGTPTSFLQDLGADVPEINMPVPDLAQVRAEDAINDQTSAPIRFAVPMAVDINVLSQGVWTDLPNGDRVCRLLVRAPGALSINFLYSDFYLPEDALLYLYSPDREEVLGAFGQHNNRDHREFATAMILHEATVLEYYEPAAVKNQGAIRIRQVAHGYRFFSRAENGSEGLGDAGSCQVNVNCSPEGDNWQVTKKAVGRITINGNSLCSGSLINNSALNCDPYFLTANHCIQGSFDAINNPNASSYVFYWNFERPGCANTGTPPTETTSGATVVANSFASGSAASASDFALFLLNSNPLDDYDVFLAGFDATGDPGNTGVGIHHPAGDAKKIATHDIIPQSVVTDRYWRIFWSQTPNGFSVTEGGSSGSPLFNEDQNIIGQLFGGFLGGQPNCSDPANDEGDYGKISYSWDNAGATIPQRRLRDWLDPVGLGTNTLVNGQSACNINCVLDGVGLTSIVCDDNGTPGDDTDDFITFTIDPTGTDLSLFGYTVTGPGGFTADGNYGSPTSFSTAPGTAGGADFLITVTDKGVPTCQAQAIVTNPGTCSADGCVITSIDVSNVTCNDNGTPTDPTDDYIDFTILVSSLNSGNLYKVFGPIIGNNRGNFGVPKNFRTANGTAGNGDITFDIQDGGEPSCASTFILVDPGVCSFGPPPCALSDAGLANVICNDNGTGMDPSDDFLSFTLNPTGDNLGSGYTVTGAQINGGSANYGQATAFTTTAGTASLSSLSLTVTDNDDSACSVGATIQSPGTCSNDNPDPDCVITSSGLSAVACNNNGTGTDPSDDFITFSLSPSGSDLGSSYSVTANGNSLGSGSYGIPANFTIGSTDAGAPSYNIVITDNSDGSCQFTDSFTNPGTCSDDPPVNNCDLSGATCQDYTLNLTSSGFTAISVQDLLVVSDPSCNYSIKLVVPFRNRFDCDDIGNQTITVRITDEDGNTELCDLTLTVADPNNFCNESAGGESFGGGVSTINVSPALTVFPNPNRGSFVFTAEAGQGEAANVQLINRFGQVVWKQSWTALPAGTIEVNSKLPAGIYLLQLDTKGERHTRKVVVTER